MMGLDASMVVESTWRVNAVHPCDFVVMVLADGRRMAHSRKSCSMVSVRGAPCGQILNVSVVGSAVRIDIVAGWIEIQTHDLLVPFRDGVVDRLQLPIDMVADASWKRVVDPWERR